MSAWVPQKLESEENDIGATVLLGNKNKGQLGKEREPI